MGSGTFFDLDSGEHVFTNMSEAASTVILTFPEDAPLESIDGKTIKEMCEKMGIERPKTIIINFATSGSIE